MRSVLPSAVAVGLLVAAVSTTSAVAPASAGRAVPATHVTAVKVHRGGPDATIAFHRASAGEAFLNVTVSARGVSWADRGNTSAVVSAYVDDRYATDIVITSASPVGRQFALGNLRAGRHTLRLHYAAGRSPSDAGVASLQDIGIWTMKKSSPGYVAARYAPVLYGRNVAATGDRFQNNHTDTPLVAWHEVRPAATRGHSIIEYSVVWSNEDGGTSPPALMARWGRTTDIEWIYRVEVDARGHRVPGSEVFQSPAHGTTVFHGRYDGSHPLLQTCTSNNNVCDKPTLAAQHQAQDPMRFSLSTRQIRPSGQPREHLMDRHPWTYQVMAREMVRERKIEPSSDPDTFLLGDQRTYLYLAVDHDTVPAGAAGVVGLAVDVRLKADPTHAYLSDHDISTWTVNRDDPAATTVELPAGTKPVDIASIAVTRVPSPFDPTNTASLHVTDLNRAFFLGTGYLPHPTFARLRLDTTLTVDSPTAVIWPAS
jgi:hypothetical protein